MTEVLNRRSGLELLGKEFDLSTINGKNLIVCFVDVDRLKMINDGFGHEEGDKTLISVAKILRESIRKTDFVIRMGGDEFLVVFPKTTMKEVNKVWYRVCRMVEEVNINNDKYNLSLSYGFCEYRKQIQKEMSINDLIKNADTEMYKKKIRNSKKENQKCNATSYKILSEIATGRDFSTILDGSKNMDRDIRGGSRGCCKFNTTYFTLGCRFR